MPVGAWELEYGCSVIADPNRVAMYVTNAQSGSYVVSGANTLAPYGLSLSTLKVNCGCNALNWTATSPGATPQAVTPYTTPAADAAPWYTATVPESAHFWGWMVEKVEAMAGTPITRSVNDRISSFGGAALGMLRRKGRMMKITLLGFGGYESAMDYGFRWLVDTLTSENESGELCDMTVRTACPTFTGSPTYSQWDTGRWTFKDVGVVEGPLYEEHPTPSATCNVRRVSFTVAASVPFGHKCPTQVMTDSTWITNLWTNPATCPPLTWVCTPGSDKTCVNISSASPLGEDAIVVEVTAGTRDIYNLLVTITPNPLGRTCSTLADTPCDTIKITSLPSGYVLRYDSVMQSVTVTLPGGEVRDGTSLIDTSTGTPPTFPAVRGGQFCVCISSDRCSWDADGAKASVWTVHRELAI